MSITPTHLLLLASVALAVGFLRVIGGIAWLRTRAEKRLVYGLPWATLATAALLIGFYLLMQGGLSHWEAPLTVPFRTWSWFYPTGLLTAGFAHASPGHLVGNLAGLIAFGSVVEYAIGHYRPPSTADTDTRGRLGNPRARVGFVIVTMLALAIAPTPVKFGWTLGYSGAVFALAGIALVARPLAGVIAIVAADAVRVLTTAGLEPTVTATKSAGPPRFPGWASIAFQSHLIGFLLGLLLGIWLVRRRDRTPSGPRLFGALLAFSLANSLWLVSWPGSGETQVLYRALGVAGVLGLSVLATIETSTVSLPNPDWRSGVPSPGTSLARSVQLPSRLGKIALWAAITLVALVFLPWWVVVGVAVVVILAELAREQYTFGRRARLPDRLSAISLPSLGAAGSILFAVLIGLATLGAIVSPATVSAAPVADTGELTVRDYTITYAENVTEGRTFTLAGDDEEERGAQSAGLLVVSERRSVWSEAVAPDELAYEGNATVRVGGLGWEERIDADRSGWVAHGNGTAYAVNLTHDGTTIRSFTSQPVTVDGRIDGHTISVVPTADGFELRVTREDEHVGTTPVPSAGESTTVGPVSVSATAENGTTVLRADTGDTGFRIAKKETSPGAE